MRAKPILYPLNKKNVRNFLHSHSSKNQHHVVRIYAPSKFEVFSRSLDTVYSNYPKDSSYSDFPHRKSYSQCLASELDSALEVHQLFFFGLKWIETWVFGSLVGVSLKKVGSRVLVVRRWLVLILLGGCGWVIGAMLVTGGRKRGKESFEMVILAWFLSKKMSEK